MLKIYIYLFRVKIFIHSGTQTIFGEIVPCSRINYIFTPSYIHFSDVLSFKHMLNDALTGAVCYTHP